MATNNAATTYLEHKILDFLFKNNSSSFATPSTGQAFSKARSESFYLFFV